MALDTTFKGEPYFNDAATTDHSLVNVFRGLPESFDGAGGGGAVTLALTGVAASTQLGVANMQSTAPELALYGNASATAAGTLVPIHTTAITGNGLAASVGSMIAGQPVALTGTVSTTSVGVVFRTIPLDLTGLALTTAAGILAAQRGIGVPGISADTAAGLISGSDGEKRVAGQETETGTGTLGLRSTNSVTGNGSTLALGSTVAGIGAGTQSVAAAGRTGNIQQGIAIALTGASMASGQGSVASGRSVALAGLQMASAVGFIRLTGLTGVVSTAAAGNVLAGRGTTGNALTATIGSASVGVTITIGGVQATGAVGRFVSKRQPGRDPTMVSTAQEQIHITGV